MRVAPTNTRQTRTATSVRFNSPPWSPIKAVRKLYYATAFCESPLPRDVMSAPNWASHLGVVAAVVLVASCGPPLSEPSSDIITGRWQSPNQIGSLSSIVLDMTQSADGAVTGRWSANVFPPNPACPPGLGSGPAGGAISGTHTVLELRMELVGAGNFAGQAIDDSNLNGSFTSCSGAYPMTFVRVSAAPAG